MSFLDRPITVFKFGGGSVKDAAGVKNLRHIVEMNRDKHLFVVISAVGKTTNLLEKILNAYFYGKEDVAPLFEQLKSQHLQIARELTPQNERIIAKLDSVFKQIEERLQREPSDNYEFEYDQIVSFGEVLSTKLISTYLNISGVRNHWLDARQVLQTDRTYMEARINWEDSETCLREAIE